MPDQVSQPTVAPTHSPEQFGAVAGSIELIQEDSTKAGRWSRANTVATLEMLGFAIVGSVLAKSTTLDSEAIQQLLSDAASLFGTTAVPIGALKALIEFMRSDQ